MRSLIMSGVVVAAVCCAMSSRAQSAYEINRLNRAIQVCNSPAGATIAECAKLRGQLGLAPASPATAGGSALGSLLGQAMSARRTPPATTPATNTAALQQNVAACVRDAAGDERAIQACLASASRSTPPTPPASASPFAPRPAADTATSIYGAGQSYQACVAADQANWRRCLPLLNGGQPAR